MTTGTTSRGSVDALATRVLDLTVSVVALIVLSPVMALVALMIRLTSPGPALFRQERVGVDGQPFVMLKFRTMRPGTPDDVAREMIERELRGEDTSVDGSFKPPDGPHVTRIGGLLRRTSLDELPQLVNVLRGDMALVGPRPCLRWEADMFPPFATARFSVKPGITGLWQVSGRSTLGTLDMLRFDVEYAATRSFAGDLKILVGTFTTLFRGDGAR
jgi:lipopolysaccharide/colanic/teichoic acid biosynthesis glycosyltransferase